MHYVTTINMAPVLYPFTHLTRTPEEEAQFEKDVHEFWDHIVMKDGKMDEEQVWKELADFYFVMNEYTKVLSHATGGQMSKCLYFASEINNVIDQHYEDQNDSYILDDVKQAYEAMDMGDMETAKEILYPLIREP